MKLPDMYGWDICRKIKENPQTASIMVLELSATLATPHDRARGLELGADAYLIHPVELVELVATLRALFRLRSTFIAVLGGDAVSSPSPQRGEGGVRGLGPLGFIHFGNTSENLPRTRSSTSWLACQKNR